MAACKEKDLDALSRIPGGGSSWARLRLHWLRGIYQDFRPRRNLGVSPFLTLHARISFRTVWGHVGVSTLVKQAGRCILNEPQLFINALARKKECLITS